MREDNTLHLAFRASIRILYNCCNITFFNVPLGTLGIAFLAAGANLSMLYAVTINKSPRNKFSNLDHQQKALALSFAGLSAFSVFAQTINHVPAVNKMGQFIWENGFQAFLTDYELDDEPSASSHKKKAQLPHKANNLNELEKGNRRFLLESLDTDNEESRTLEEKSFYAGKPLLLSTITAALFGIATYATWNQSTLTSKSELFWGGEGVKQPTDLQIKLLATPCFIGLMGEILFINLAHLLSLIWGKERVLTESATGEGANSFSSPCYKGMLSVITIGAHVAQSALYSDVESGALEILAIIAFSLLESVTHLNHGMALSEAYTSFCARSTPMKCLATLLGILGGIQEASPALLSWMHFHNNSDTYLEVIIAACILVEFSFGFLEMELHVVPEAASQVTKLNDWLFHSPTTTKADPFPELAKPDHPYQMHHGR